MIVDNRPFISFFSPQRRSEPDVLFGFTLPALPISSQTSAAMQLRLVQALWASGITALEIRFVTTSNLTTTIYLLCRIRRPQQVDKRMFQDFYSRTANRIVQLCNNCGYQLQPLTSETLLIQALAPFQTHALAELRRSEELMLLSDAFTKYEIYGTHSWEWVAKEQLELIETLKQQGSPGLISIHLEPTILYKPEQESLTHATSGKIRDLLWESGVSGEAIYTQYLNFAQRLQQPYLWRICLAAPAPQSLERLGQTILDQTQYSEVTPILQFPQDAQEWQAAIYNLRYLEWIPWGNIRDNTPETARLRYLVDSRGASIGFHLPLAPEPLTSETQEINVLLVFSDPHLSSDAPQRERNLHLGSDDRIIQESIKRSRYRDKFSFTICHPQQFTISAALYSIKSSRSCIWRDMEQMKDFS